MERYGSEKALALLRQLSYAGAAAPERGSGRWGRRRAVGEGSRRTDEGETTVAKKRVMAVIDDSARAKFAMMWALNYVANKGDVLTLLYVVSSASGGGGAATGGELGVANSLSALCRACRPEVEVEALVIQGPKLPTVLSQVRKLEASVLVLSQGKPSPFCCLFRSRGEEFAENCINRADCLALAVRKQRKGVGGYLVSSRWHKNFWLLA